jgi:hypothetical protein
MKTTIVTFKCLIDGKIKHKNIPIEHNLEVIPSSTFLGYKLPEESIESQVIDYLDNMDKTDLMRKYRMDIIFNYWVKKKKKKKDEINEFLDYCEPYLNRYPVLVRQFSAIVSESKDVLFGHGKSNETKFKEVLNSISLVNKSIDGVLDVLGASIQKRIK